MEQAIIMLFGVALIAGIFTLFVRMQSHKYLKVRKNQNGRL